MKQVRYGCFETNSSSMHSLIIMNKDEYYTKEEITKGIYIHDGIWHIYNETLRFGRSPFRALGTFEEKWLYACASLVEEYKDDVFKQLESLAFKYIPGLEEIIMPYDTDCVRKKENNDEYSLKYGKLEDELVDYLCEKQIEWNVGLEYWEDGTGRYWRYDTISTGSIDEDILSGFLTKNNVTLEEFLINKRYVVIQDGDEYNYWQDIKDTGLINMDMIESEYPTDEDYKGAE